MKQTYTLVTPPATLAVTVAQAKAQAVVDHSLDDTLIESYVKAAIEQIEGLLGLRLVEQTWKLTMDDFSEVENVIEILPGPVLDVEEIRVYDADGGSEVMDEDDFLLDHTSIPARIVLKDGCSWPAPSAGLREVNAVVITLQLGFAGSPPLIPERLLLAVKLLAAHYYANREPYTVAKLEQLPAGVFQLLARHRNWRAING